jgi:hypothetical protein
MVSGVAPHNMGMDLPSQLRHLLGEPGVGLQEALQVRRLITCDLLTLNAGAGTGLAMAGVGLARVFVPVRLAGLGKQ